MSFKRYKLCRKFWSNLYNDAKFAEKIYSRKIKAKRWDNFKFALPSPTLTLPISRYFGDAQLLRKKYLISFDVRNKRRFLTETSSVISSHVMTLEQALLAARFFRTPKEVSFFIAQGNVFVNGKVFYKKRSILTEGDLITLDPSVNWADNWKKTILGTSPISNNASAVRLFGQISARVEVSYSSKPALVFCYILGSITHLVSVI